MTTDLQAPPPAPSAAAMPGDEHYARNLIGGSWQFPAAPFEFEIRNPLDSTVTTVVPLSSRLDVARAVAAARAASPHWAAAPRARRDWVARLADGLETHEAALARLQSLETGLAPTDSRATVRAVTALARQMIAQSAAADPEGTAVAGVSGHVLSWGLPLAEVTCAVLPHLLAGRTAVIKPSLRAPLSATAVAHLATGLGFPAGVINVVQGTGLDVGTALASTPGLAALHVRGGDRTLDQAARAATVTGAALHPLRAGGNILLVGSDADPDLVAAAAVEALRLHSAGGPLSLPLLGVQAGAAGPVVDAVLARLDGCAPAPLPSEPLRRRALARVAALAARGGRVLRGGTVPDDAAHRMGWLMPPTVITAGAVRGGPASPGLATAAGEPTGPVLTIVTWRSPAELAGILPHPRYADGIACAWGLDDADITAAQLPHRAVLTNTGPATAVRHALLPAAWTGGYDYWPYDARPGR